jgi:hypothetical protein
MTLRGNERSIRPASLKEKAVNDVKVVSDIDDNLSSSNHESRIVGLGVEEVFAEGPRLIDLGADGKERPIGAF